jgi:adenine-specific DNA-methyltransferase
LKDFRDKAVNGLGYDSYKEAKKELDECIVEKEIYKFALDNKETVFRLETIGDDAGKETITARDISKADPGKVYIVRRDKHDDRYILNGQEIAFYSKKVKNIDGELKPSQMLTNIWTDISWEGIAKEGGIKLKKGKKPEKLLKRIIDMTNIDKNNEIIMDFFVGSGTTCAVAHKMGYQYIGIEQLDYGKNDSVTRLKNVSINDQSGVSKIVGWKGGGSFFYAELKKWNQAYIDEIEVAKTTKDLLAIYEKMKAEAFFRYDLDLSKFDEKEFEKLELGQQKDVLIECLDKNHLYVNLSEMDDAT